MAKKENEFIKIFLLLSCIFFVYVSVRSCYKDMKHPRPYAPPGWDLVQVNEIESITLSPLLSLSVQGLTIDSKVEISNKSLIRDIWNEMQGKKRARLYTGHWFKREMFKISFHLLSGNKMAFRITFHADKDVADYYKLKNPDLFFCVSGDADKGSPELYEILNEVIHKSGAQWITANSDCWNTDGPLTYVGCSD